MVCMMKNTNKLATVISLTMIPLFSCSSELAIEFRGTVQENSTGLALPGVQAWCMAVVEADSLVPFERDHLPALTQSDGTFRDLIEFNAGTGCKEVSDEEWLREGAYFKFRRDGYDPVDTFLARDRLTRVSGYYQLPIVKMKPSILKTPSSTPAGDQ